MELRHIRYFLAVADAKSFTYAAEALGISQPPLSMQIRDLEKEVGVMLFHRIPRGVELNAAGKEFYKTIQEIPDLIERARLSARMASRGELGRLKVGFTSSSTFNPVVTKSIKKFKDDYKNIILKIDESHTNSLIHSVNNGSIDVAFVRAEKSTIEGMFDNLDINFTIQEKLSLVISDNNEFPQQEELCLKKLSGRGLILCPREYSIHMYETIMKILDKGGCTPHMKQTTPQISSIINLVSTGLGYSIVPDSMRSIFNHTHDIHFYVIKDEEAYVPLSLISRRNERSVMVKNFIAGVINMHKICRSQS